MISFTNLNPSSAITAEAQDSTRTLRPTAQFATAPES